MWGVLVRVSVLADIELEDTRSVWDDFEWLSSLSLREMRMDVEAF